MVSAVLIAIGDELLSGIRREGNNAFMAWRLHDAGCHIARMEIIADEIEWIVEALNRWVGKVDIIVLSGGLGPTHDDKTRDALAEYLGCPLEVNNLLYDRIVDRFADNAERKKLVENSRAVQALIPTLAQGVYNSAGSALGITFEKEGTKVWSFPGVPFEYQAMAEQEILCNLRHTEKHEWKSVAIAGIPESLAVLRVPEIINDKRLHISVLPSFGLVEFVIRGEAEAVSNAMDIIRERFAADILPLGCTNLPQAILYMASQKGVTLSCAESCTGGMIGAALTDIPGSSKAFSGSAVVYKNEAKQKLLGVDAGVLQRYGAVSPECAAAMAEGVLKLYETQLSVAVTGIAGPDGGSQEKPVGWVCFAIAVHKGGKITSTASQYNLGRERNLIRERSVQVALTLLWSHLKDL